MLTPTEHTTDTLTGVNQLAHDAEGRRVIVSMSREALDDLGHGAVWAAANRKYVDGDFAEADGNRTVRVTRADCS